MSDDLQITFAKGSDVGKVRDHNEDSVMVHDPAEALNTTTEAKRRGRLFIVADGMGGYLAGEVASQLAVETVVREYYADPSADPITRLQNAIQSANEAVHQSALDDRAHAGMGTTIVVLAQLDRRAYVASVGDSRAYLVRRGEISQITQDHSFVEEQIRAGLLSREQARQHPQRNIITRALGSQPTVLVDVFEGELAEGDTVVMCTDGLSGHVTDELIRDTASELPPAEAVKRLIEMANESGGTDNITTVVVRIESLKSQPPASSTGAPVLTSVGAAEPLAEPTSPVTPPAGTRAVKANPPAARKSSFSLAWIVVGALLVLAVMGIVGLVIVGAGTAWRGNWFKPAPPAPPDAPIPSAPIPSAMITPQPTGERRKIGEPRWLAGLWDVYVSPVLYPTALIGEAT